MSKTQQEQKGQEGNDNKYLFGNDQLSQILVEAQFILMEKKLSLTQLQNMVEGEVWSMPLDAEKNIGLRVNNVLFAEGELVQLADGRLGIEVHKLINK